MPYWAWSWLLMAVGASGLFVSGRKCRWGWVISVVAEALWVWYAIATTQYGFVVAAIVYAAVDIRNFIAWSRDR